MVTDSIPDLRVWLTVWLVTSLLLIYRHWRPRHGVGLMLGFIVNFGVLYGSASILHLAPSFYSRDSLENALGMRISALAIVSAAVGAEIVSRLFAKRHGQIPGGDMPTQLVSPAAVNLILLTGVLFCAGLVPLAFRFRSMTAVVGTGWGLIVMSMGLKCWNGWQLRDRRTVWLWGGASLGFPVFTVVSMGFLGYGIALMTVVVAFVVALVGPRWRLAVASAVVAYVSLSVYSTYMRDRGEIRESVWSGSSLSDRMDTAAGIVTDLEWFDPFNQQHLHRVDNRMNQNILIGHAVRYMESGAVPFANGATIYEAVLNVVPRALWPDKPIFAGSGNVVATYSGLHFAESTSVGIGTVLECYINFGTPGVVIGFLLLGAIMCLVDRAAVRSLEHGDLRRFTLWYLPGLNLLNLGTSLVEQSAMTAAAWAMAHVINYYITSRWPYMQNVRLEAPLTVTPRRPQEARL